ncbi:MAG: UvrD-helicase domain-containing protein, partial [Ilumatobacteraceae bacterium]
RGPLHDDVSLVEDPSDLIRQVVSDLLVGALADDPGLLDDGARDEPLKISTIQKEMTSIVTTVLNNLDSTIQPRVESADRAAPLASLPVEKRWAVIAEQAVHAIQDRLDRSNQLGFDGLITAVRDLLSGPEGRTVAEALRRQFHVVLVDEFQDTDQVQWDVLSRLFIETASSAGTTTLGTVGDPKQAIYRFRGADIEAYRSAVAGVEQLSALDMNFRSNKRLIDAVNQLFDGVRFGAEDIAYRRVRHRPGPDDEGVERSAALEIRWIPYSEGAGSSHPKRLTKAQKEALATGNLDLWNLNSEDMLDVIYTDVAREIGGLISGTEMIERSGAPRAIQPGDIAVLVPSHKHAERMFQVLAAAGIPAVRYRTQSVFETRAAQDWQILLEALCQPTRAPRVRACMVSGFGTYTLDELVALDDDEATMVVGKWQQDCLSWAERMQREGVSALYHYLRSMHGMEARLVPLPGGERLLTDLDHIAEALSGLGRGATAADVRRELTALRLDSKRVDEYQRRIESDDAAVHLATVHFSKGLEFPIVFLPTMFKGKSNSDPWVYNVDGRRFVDVAHKVEWTDGVESSKDRRDRAHLADLGDEMRKLYVAATRAEQKLIVHWTQVKGSFSSALGRVLLGRDEHGQVVIDPRSQAPQENKPKSNAEIHGALARIAEATPAIDLITIEPEEVPLRKRESTEVSADGLGVATFDRTTALQRYAWRKWSYSRLVRNHHGREADDATEGAMASDEDVQGGSDDENRVTSSPETVTVSPGIEFPDQLQGTRFGSLIHGLLEELNPASEEFGDRLERLLRTQRRVLPGDTADRMVVALGAVVRSPLGSLFEECTLSTIAASDRLAEARFEMRLPQTDSVGLSDIGRILLEHVPAEDPVRRYGEDLVAGSRDTRIAGSLYGEIDAVFRVRSSDGAIRYIVSDYKTNLLHPRDATRPLDHYSPRKLVETMRKGDYVLQALLYSVALHRYLRLRLPEYDPGIHYGGTSYLFLRGMVGPGVPRDDRGEPYGVFNWKPPITLIEALDERFAGRRRVS